MSADHAAPTADTELRFETEPHQMLVAFDAPDGVTGVVAIEGEVAPADCAALAEDIARAVRRWSA